MTIALYFSVLVLANILTARFAPMEVGIFLIPAGTVCIASSFFIRDFIQQQIGKSKTYLVIASALVASALVSFSLNDPLWIVLASAITFAVSESVDTEIFSRMSRPFKDRVLVSGAIGTVIDSALFVIIGLSPIGAGFLTWDFVWLAIAGQVIVKVLVHIIVYLFLLYRERVGRYGRSSE